MEMLWFWLLSGMVAVYGVLDGFDFGAGVLHLFAARTEAERREVFAAIGPLWDGNEVWLLASGGAMFMAFPRLLASSFSGFYLAMFMVIWTLLVRGIAIEFRSHVQDRMWRSFWDGAFACASALMPLLLGVALGNVLRGVPLDASGYFHMPLFTNFGVGGELGLLDWYTLLVGLLVLVTLTGHGALFLAWKTVGPLQYRCLKSAPGLCFGAALLTVAVTLATLWVNPGLYQGLARPGPTWVGIALFLAGASLVFIGLQRGRHLLAFLGSCAVILGLLVATAARLWPVMLRSSVDPAFDLTAHNASAGAYGLRAGLGWWLLALPLVVIYFVTVFRLHQGKVKAPAEGEGY